MTFCDTDIADYTIRNCGNDFAGVIGIGIISDYENPTEEELEDPDFWTAKIIETPLKYWAIRNTRGQYDQTDLIEEEDLIGTTVTGAKHNAIIDVPEIQENRNFWDAIMRHNWKLCLITSGGLMYYIDKPVSFYPHINNPRSIKQSAFFQVDMKWYDFSNPIILNAPEGIFSGNIPITGDGIFDYTFDLSFE
jgi:hypothetical protein